MAVVPPTRILTPEFPSAWGTVIGAQMVDQVGGRRVLGRRRRVDVHEHHVAVARPARDVERRRDLGHARLAGDVVDQGVDHVTLVGLDDAHEHQGAVEARSEALREHVEADAGWRTRRVGALIG